MFHYTVDFWDDKIKESQQETGLVGAATYSEAAQQISDYYGADNIVTMSMTQWEDLVTTDDLMQEIAK